MIVKELKFSIEDVKTVEILAKNSSIDFSTDTDEIIVRILEESEGGIIKKIGEYEAYIDDGKLVLAFSNLSGEISIPKDIEIDNFTLICSKSSADISGPFKTKDIIINARESSIDISDVDFIGNMDVNVKMTSLDINIDYLGTGGNTVSLNSKMTSASIGLGISSNIDVEVSYESTAMSSVNVDGRLHVENPTGKLNINLNVKMSSIDIEILR